MTFILIMTCFFSPLDLAFSYNDPKSINWFTVVDYSIDFCYLIDICIVFNSAYINDALVLIDNRKEIAKNYFKGWFVIDIISIIPFSLLLSYSPYHKLARVARVGRLYKLVKLTKLIRILKVMKD